MSYKVISFYTIGTGYENEINALRQSLDKFRIPNYIQGIPDSGSWEENAKLKPIFIRNTIDIVKEQAVVWLDADSVVQRHPDLFNRIETDVAFYFKTTGPTAARFGGYELISAAMYFRNNDCVRTLLDMWIDEECRSQQPEKNLIEQRALQRVLPVWQKKRLGSVTYLPQSYCRIFDAPEDHCVIVQNQASRRLRNQRA